MTKRQQKTHLLIDGDVVAFIAAAASQSVFINEFGWASPQGHTVMGEATVENMLFALKAGLKADSFEVILSDPDDNWRKAVDERYKTNRVGERPVLLDYLKQYLRDKHGAYHWAGLEADDTLGILMTTPPPCELLPQGSCNVCGLAADEVDGCLDSPRRLICVGRDKDFKSIPGLHHMIKHDVGPKGELLVREVSQWEADRFHMVQTLAGDKVDGYDGCPGIGMVSAERIIDNPVRLVPQEGIITRGVNKGKAVTKWMAEPTSDYWACIVSHYRKAGLNEDDALRTARLARILRHGEYDPETEELTLWTPDKLIGVAQ